MPIIKYLVINECGEAYSPSKYADMYNLGPITSGYPFDDESIAKSKANNLNKVCEYSKFKAVPVIDALIEDMNRHIVNGMQCDVCKSNSNYIRNQFLTISNDFIMLLKELDLDVNDEVE